MAVYTIHIKQGYKLKNWVEGISDEAYYPGPGSHQSLDLKHGKKLEAILIFAFLLRER